MSWLGMLTLKPDCLGLIPGFANILAVETWTSIKSAFAPVFSIKWASMCSYLIELL